MTLFSTASSFYGIFTQVPKSFNSTRFAGRFLEASWRRCHSFSGCSLSRFVLLLHVIPDRLDDDQISVWSTGCFQTPCANKNLTGLLQVMAK